MRRIESIAIGLIFGAVPIIGCSLAGWWLIIPYVPERLIFGGLLAGLFTGIVIDVLFLRQWIRRAYSMSPIAWSGIYLFYSVGLFGMFMGVPIFNVGLAVPAGCFVGAYLANREAQPPEVKVTARRSSLVTTGILALICITSATIALIDPYTAGSLERMLGLPFHVTTMMIIGLILIGGSLLLALHWWLTMTSAELTYRYFSHHAGQLPTSR